MSMSSTERSKRFRERKRLDKKLQEYTEFLKNTPFPSATTEAEKICAFNATKMREKAMKKKMQANERKKRYRLKQKMNMVEQALEKFQKSLPEYSTSPIQKQNDDRQKGVIQFDGEATTYIISPDGCVEGVQSNVEPKTYEAAGPSKRLSDVAQDQGKMHKEKPAKKMKAVAGVATADNYGVEEDSPENCFQEPFEMIEIEEPILKQEMFEPEEFVGLKQEDVSSIQSTQKSQIETVFCTPELFKTEPPDVEDFPPPLIKVEPLDIVEDEKQEQEDGKEEGSIPQGKPIQMWCCQMKFESQFLFNLHCKLNHAIKDVALAPAPSDAIPSLSVPSSCCGPVTVTTTFSYSSLTTSTPLTTSISGSSITCSKLISSPSTIVTHPPPASSLDLPSITPASASSFSIDTPSRNISLSSSNPIPKNASHRQKITVPSHNISSSSSNPTNAPHGQKIVVPQISNPNDSSTAPKRSLITTEPSSEKKLTRPSKTQPIQMIQVIQPKELKVDHLYQCAIDDSEMFSISLAEFSKDKRVSIKQKFVEVIGCIKQKNVSPEKLLIAYSDNSFDSRTM